MLHASSRLAAIAATFGLSVWSAAQAPSPSTSSSTQPQGNRPVFRGGVDLIQLDVTVLDRRRHPVTGLNASDFTVFENGVQRPVQAFTSVQLPAPFPIAGASAAVPVDVATNSIGQQEGRIVIILMDRTIPTGQPTRVAKAIAAAAVDALGPDDLAALV